MGASAGEETENRNCDGWNLVAGDESGRVKMRDQGKLTAQTIDIGAASGRHQHAWADMVRENGWVGANGPWLDERCGPRCRNRHHPTEGVSDLGSERREAGQKVKKCRKHKDIH